MLQKALKQTTTELEEATTLADVLYKTCRRMGSVINHLKDYGIERQHSEFLEIMLSRVRLVKPNPGT